MNRQFALRPFIVLGAGAAFATACGGGGSSSSLANYGAGGSTNDGGSNDSGSNKVASFEVTRTDLVSDQAGVAPVRDKNLVNAWGIAVNPTGSIWVSDNGTGLATVYSPDGRKLPLVVTVPVPSGAQGPSAPTGQVFNPTNGFMGDIFIIATEDGTIAGWQSGNGAALRVDNSGSGAIYKGIAIVGKDTSAPTLWASNFNAGTIDVWDMNYTAMSTGDGFTDPDLPAGYAPFNIAAIDDRVYVTYAKQDADKKDDVKGAGNGFVSVFKTDGTFDKRLISNGDLDAPWGLAKAPSSFAAAGSLFVGNFGDGRINVYDIDSGAPVARVTDSKGKPLVIDGLWGLVFIPSAEAGADAGADAGGGMPALYFTAGPNDEKNGLLGKLEMR